MHYRCAVTKAIIYRKEMALMHNEKITLLKEDVLNSPYHVFGSHSECARYTFCTVCTIFFIEIL